jgi:hypothetical protein
MCNVRALIQIKPWGGSAKRNPPVLGATRRNSFCYSTLRFDPQFKLQDAVKDLAERMRRSGLNGLHPRQSLACKA